jgi:hypothetical protein
VRKCSTLKVRVTLRLRVRVTLRLSVDRQSVRLGDKLLETQDQKFVQLNILFHSPYVTTSLTRGWVCSLLLLALISSVILRSDSCGKRDHISLPKILGSPYHEGQVPVFLSPRSGLPSYTPKHWVPFSPPPSTRWDVVKVFDPTSTLAMYLVI